MNLSNKRLKCAIQRAVVSLLWAGAIVVGLVSCSPATAQLVLEWSGSERNNLSGFIARGTNPLDIRATSIHDPLLVSVLLQGSRTRHIRILLDETSREIKQLFGKRNIDIRFSARDKQGKFGDNKLSHSFVLEKGKGYYQMWSGALSWSKSAFGTKSQLLAGSGKDPSRAFVREAQAFEHNFAVAKEFKDNAMPRSSLSNW